MNTSVQPGQNPESPPNNSQPHVMTTYCEEDAGIVKRMENTLKLKDSSMVLGS